MKIRNWFDRFTLRTNERPTHIVFGWGDRYGIADDNDGWDIEEDHIVTFDDVPDSIMDREFDDGFGGNDTPNLCAWSRSWVIFSENYDGAEGLQWVPNSPSHHNPIRPGGG